MTRAVIYVRISKDPEGRQVGVDRQEKDCRELAARLGFDVLRVFVDNDVSASTLSRKPRPAYQEMMTLAEAGQVAVILAYSNSRLTRRPLELERLIVAHDRTGVEFRTAVSGQDDLSTADGRMVARIKASVDAAESERIGERTRRAKQEARDEGRWPGGWRPYGWEADGRTVRPDEGAVIAEISRAILEGRSVASIVRSLNDRRLPTSTGKQWASRGLLRVLSRPHPAVDESTGEAVRILLRDPARRTSPGPERRWLLSGLAICDVCKESIRGSGSSLGSGRGTYPAYRCSSGKHVVINAVTLDEYIRAAAVERLSRPSAADAFPSPVGTTDGLRAEAASLRIRLDALADDLDVDERTLARRAKALRLRLDALEEQLAVAAATSPLAVFATLAGRREAVADAWDGLELTRRRAAVAVLMAITVRRTTRGVVPLDHRWRDELPTFDPRRVVIDWRGAGSRVLEP